MMSIAQVRSAGSAGNYYTDKDNYYVLGSMGERWAGRGAEQLGLQGSVDKDVFTRLLEGRLPDGADLSRMQDGSNRHRPGYDLTFSAPKSVSMMAMLGGELITGRRQLLEGMTFTPGSTVIVDQGEKLSLKETLTLLDGAARHNVQVLIIDSGQRTGTGSALMAMKDAGVNTYRWQGGEQRPATIISEPDRNVRYARLAGDFAVSVKAGEESVAQVSGVRERPGIPSATVRRFLPPSHRWQWTMPP